MKYRALIADDEPLVLVGLQSMVSWDDLDTSIMKTCRNGNELMDEIRSSRPDFVILDIRMPGMTGLEVMKKCSEEGMVLPVFVLLTSSEEFEYVREAMKYGAVDYLVKIELTPETLSDAVRKAQKRVIETGAENRISQEPEAPFLDKFYLRLITGSTGMDRDALIREAESLGIERLDEKCTASYLEMKSREESAELSLSVVKLLHETLKQKTPCHVIPLDMHHIAIVFFLSPDNARHYTGYVSGALKKAAELAESYFSVTIRSSVGTVTELLEAKRSYEAAKKAFQNMKENETIIFASEADDDELFSISPWVDDITSSIRENDAALFRSAISSVSSEIEKLSSLSSIYADSSILHLVIDEIPGGEDALREEFTSSGLDYRVVYRASGTDEAVSYLNLLADAVMSILSERRQDYRARLVVRIQKYIKDNLEKKLTLSEVASVFGISQNYLSSIFPKYAGVGFIEYITKLKMDEAKRMLAGGNPLIYEIASELGYDSAFYFSKVFKKSEGISPREYARKISDSNS